MIELPRWRLPASPITVWAVEDTTVQVCWGDLPAGEVTATAADTVATLDHHGGPGSVVLGDLPSGSPLTVEISWDGGRRSLPFRTLPPPPGELVARIATVSDLHLGAKHWGFFKTMTERRAGWSGEGGEAAPFRSAHAAITEAQAWGAQQLIVKGDAAHHRRADHFSEVGRLLDGFADLPTLLLPGNHDVDDRGDAPLPDTVGHRRVPYIRDVEFRDLPGIRLIAGDTTIEGAGKGTVSTIGDHMIELAAASDRPVLVATHQQFQRYPITTHWPPGVAAPESTGFIARLGAANPNAVVTSGHTHRNRAHQLGSVLHTEVASTRDWPGVWAGYAVHEGGIRQVVRRIAAPDAIAWHEYSKNAVLGVWQYWSPGRLKDRCLVNCWTEAHRPGRR